MPLHAWVCLLHANIIKGSMECMKSEAAACPASQGLAVLLS